MFSFSKPLNAARAQDLGNYGYYLTSAGPDGSFGTSDDGFVTLAAAQYNPAAMTVTVIPVTPPALQRLLPDRDRRPGQPASQPRHRRLYLATCSRGRATASPAHRSCALWRRPPVELYRQPGQDGQSQPHRSRCHGSLPCSQRRRTERDPGGHGPGKSVLSLHANKSGGTYTFLPPIQGAAGVRFRYRTPPIVFRSSPVVRRP